MTTFRRFGMPILFLLGLGSFWIEVQNLKESFGTDLRQALHQELQADWQKMMATLDQDLQTTFTKRMESFLSRTRDDFDVRLDRAEKLLAEAQALEWTLTTPDQKQQIYLKRELDRLRHQQVPTADAP